MLVTPQSPAHTPELEPEALLHPAARCAATDRAHATPTHATVPGRRAAGFTLIEIMAVVVIMGMLMTVLAVGVTSQIDKARISNARAQITRIEQALEFYKLDNRRFPNDSQGLDALVSRPSAPPEPKDYNPAGYIKRDQLEDPWGEPFKYRMPGQNNPYTFDIWSYGPDGVEGGDDDIQNWATGDNG